MPSMRKLTPAELQGCVDLQARAIAELEAKVARVRDGGFQVIGVGGDDRTADFYEEARITLSTRRALAATFEQAIADYENL